VFWKRKREGEYKGWDVRGVKEIGFISCGGERFKTLALRTGLDMLHKHKKNSQTEKGGVTYNLNYPPPGGKNPRGEKKKIKTYSSRGNGFQLLTNP